MKSLTPIILIIAAVALFFGFTDPTYVEVKALKEEQQEYKNVLMKSEQLQEKRDALQKKYVSIDDNDIVNINKILPDTVDNVRLILDLSRIADNTGIKIKNINIDEGSGPGKSRGATDLETKPYGTIKIDFSFSAPYENFLDFMDDLEKSLRLVDVEELKLSSGKDGVYEFQVKIQTYWLR